MQKHPISPRTEFALSPSLLRGQGRSKPWGPKDFVLTLVCISLFAMLSGCTVNLTKGQPAAGLPEDIYITSPEKDYGGARVVVFPFESPPIQKDALYIKAPDPGYGASAGALPDAAQGRYFSTNHLGLRGCGA